VNHGSTLGNLPGSSDRIAATLRSIFRKMTAEVASKIGIRVSSLKTSLNEHWFSRRTTAVGVTVRGPSLGTVRKKVG
jgi:hypothetical protein